MRSRDEFIDLIDNMIPREIQESLERDFMNLETSDAGFMDLVNLQERARVLTIKEKISSTHRWSKATCIDSKGHRSDVFWCDRCNIRCSSFEHIFTISIVSKVNDNKPTYTVHNDYLMLTCDEARNIDSPGNDYRCFDCGISERGKTDKCVMAEC